MDRSRLDAILQKIRRLQALAGSSNVHEAALAASRVKEMLLRHDLTLEQLEARPEDDGYRARHAILVQDAAWAVELFSVVAHHCYCRAFAAGPGRRHVCIVGTEGDIEVATRLYGFLCTELEQLAAGGFSRTAPEHGVRPHEWRRTFFEGAVSAIHERLAARQAALEQADAACRALVVVKDSRMDAAVERLLGRTRPAPSEEAAISLRAFLAGHDAGSRVVLDPMVEGPGDGPV